MGTKPLGFEFPLRIEAKPSPEYPRAFEVYDYRDRFVSRFQCPPFTRADVKQIVDQCNACTHEIRASWRKHLLLDAVYISAIAALVVFVLWGLR